MSLLVGELTGYLGAIFFYSMCFGRLIPTGPGSVVPLKIAFGVYLLALAGRTWSRSAEVPNDVVSFRRVLVTTLLNPKALFLALVVIPGASPHWGVYVAAFSLMVPSVGSGWIIAGREIGRSAGAHISVLPKVVAIVLSCLSAVVFFSAFRS
jgi:threonine/homoserine/homoserine lactone efflux protein